ncbi:MAG: CoA transferase [Rhodospirillales bacterium]|nr:CoA transferase [Rhodospirillales bacterium]
MRPLDGITVVALEHALSAPYATRHLADLGARVIKIERPGVGDFARHYDTRVKGLSSYFVWSNRSKESLTLDVKHPKAGAILRRLIGKADVLVQNLAPGAAARLGLTHDDLKADNPRLIVCNISGYGEDGPDRDRKAYDLMIQSEAGFLTVTGTPDTPSKAGISIADIASGMYAYSAILAALISRGKTGEGASIDVSMLECMVEWMGFPLYYASDDAPPPARTGGSHATIAPYGPFAAGDGKVVMLGLQNDREWRNFCDKVLEDPALFADPRFRTNAARAENAAALRGIILSAFACLSGDEVVARLDAAGIASARMNDMHDVWSHRQLRARHRWVEIDSAAGPLPALLPPGGSGAFAPLMGPVPELGQHTRAILAELGLSADDIAALAKDNAI